MHIVLISFANLYSFLLEIDLKSSKLELISLAVIIIIIKAKYCFD